jgi:hypothetical protein
MMMMMIMMMTSIRMREMTTMMMTLKRWNEREETSAHRVCCQNHGGDFDHRVLKVADSSLNLSSILMSVESASQQ